LKVLLVEDNAGDARLFSELISDIPGQPLRLTTVGALAPALDIAAQHDVVFLDLSLPDAHGLVTVSRMVAAARNLPIVVLTGNEDERLAVDAVKAGAQDYLTKSEITPSLIARTARYAVERKAAEENTRRLAKSDEAAQRARFISTLTTAITSSFDLGVTLAEVARLCLPTLGDYAVIDLVRDGGTIERVAIAAHDPAIEATVRRYLQFVPGTSHPHTWVTTAIDTREPVHIQDMTSVETAGDPDFRELVQTLRPRTLFVMPLQARGRVVGALSFTMLASSGRRFDVELQQLIAEVAERIALGIDNASLYASAQRAIQGRDELLAVVSHDLRNPLNLIGLALQMIEQDPSALDASLPSAKRGVDRMQRLIEDLLDVARIEAGTLNVEPRPMSLGSLLEDAFEQHRALAADKRITLVRDFDKRLGGVLADRHRMAQAISNLVGNALKFTPAGGSIRIGGESNGDRASLWVADTGPGIAPEHVAHIFDRFWQPTRGRDGVGLGLAIVKGIIDAHEGRIEVESTPGAGTTFRISLRAAEARPTSEMAPLAIAR
jgi:signal transduction histidine kinase